MIQDMLKKQYLSFLNWSERNWNLGKMGFMFLSLCISCEERVEAKEFAYKTV